MIPQRKISEICFQTQLFLEYDFTEIYIPEMGFLGLIFSEILFLKERFLKYDFPGRDFLYKISWAETY